MPNWVLLPEVIPASGVGTNADRVLKYPGIKEDVYVSRFEPDPRTRSQLQVKEDDVLVMVRPPADEAHYHNPESGVLYHAVMEFLGDKPNVRVILLPRDERQKAAAFRAWPGLLASGRVTIPSHVSDGRNLIWHSDLVISGGGTMNREAAALGVPVYSIFRGKIGAVDRYLAEKGRLVLLQSPDEIPNKIRLIRRPVPAKPASGDRAVLDAIVNTIVSIAETGCPPSKDTANLL
jgi:uncharacterized protein